MEIDPLKKMGWKDAGIQGNAIVTGARDASKTKPDEADQSPEVKSAEASEESQPSQSNE